MQIKRFVLGEYQSNCYIISYNQKAAVIDPGYENNEVIPYLEKNQLDLKYIFITHGHFDHVGGVNQLKKNFPNTPVIINYSDLIWLDENEYNLTGKKVHYDLALKEETSFFLDDLEIKIIFIPGHTEGSQALIVNNFVFTGDTLFQFTIGRYDFPFANYDKLYKSIKRLYTLPDEMVVLPGHGHKTSIGFEKKNNFFINENN